MVLIKEFRIVMPLTIEEYHKGQRYSVARSSKEVTSGANGIEVLKNEPYKDEKTGKTGVYTQKIYHLEGYMPAWVKKLLPKSALILYEEAWDCFPYCKTVITSPFLGKKFSLIIESQHHSDSGQVENALDLSESDLKIRKIEYIDIISPLADKKMYKKEEDPKLVKLKNKEIGPLSEGWQKKAKDVVCCYKLVRCDCKIFGFQKKAEKYMLDFEYTVFLRFHKQLFCWLDEWYGLSDTEIEKFTKEMYDAMNTEITKNVKERPEDLMNVTDKEAEKHVKDLEDKMKNQMEDEEDTPKKDSKTKTKK